MSVLVRDDKNRKNFYKMDAKKVSAIDFQIADAKLELKHWQNEVKNLQRKYFAAISRLNEIRQELVDLKRQASPRSEQIAQELLAIYEKGALPKRLFDIPTFRAVEYVMHILGGDTKEDATEGWQLFLTYRADTQ